MGEVVNLSRARKARAKAKATEQAAANRAKHGRSKADRARDSAEQARRKQLLDGARRQEEPEA